MKLFVQSGQATVVQLVAIGLWPSAGDVTMAETSFAAGASGCYCERVLFVVTALWTCLCKLLLYYVATDQKKQANCVQTANTRDEIIDGAVYGES